jgi:hypothetical protein
MTEGPEDDLGAACHRRSRDLPHVAIWWNRDTVMGRTASRLVMAVWGVTRRAWHDEAACGVGSATRPTP